MKKNAVAIAAIAVVATGACELTIGIGSQRRTTKKIDGAPGPANKPLDILFVLDNSASMADEQAALAQTIYQAGCPIADLQNVPQALLNPEPGSPVLEELVRVCGFSQILAAYDRDFRVGVITTDVNACDNFIPEAQGGFEHGFHPQRGCLQPVPQTGQKLIERSDVDVAGKFRDLIGNIGTFGSPFERGLDAADVFLNPEDTWVAEGCEGDRDSFLREEAQLMLVFVTDEDDCSHKDGAFGFADETLTRCGEDASIFNEHNPGDCYEHPEQLAPVGDYMDRFRALKGEERANDVFVTVIAGAVLGAGEFIASSCMADTNGVPVGEDQCRPSRGLSNFTGPGQPCDPALGEPCCTADAAGRYFEMRDALAQVAASHEFVAGSICTADYDDTLIEATQRTENDG